MENIFVGDALQKIVISVCIIAVLLALTWFSYSYLLKRFMLAAQKTSWKWDEVVLKTLRKALPFLSVILCAYILGNIWDLPKNIQLEINKFLFSSLIFVGTFITASLASNMIIAYRTKEDGAVAATTLTMNIVNATIIIVGALVLLNHLGVAITPMLTAMGVGGIAIALGLQETLSNVFAGIYIIGAGKIRLGDYIKLSSGEEGYVHDIAWRETRIRMLSKNIVTIPNSQLAKVAIINYNMPTKEVSFAFEFGVDYNSDLDQVESVSISVVKEAMQALWPGRSIIEPLVRYQTFGDSSINLKLFITAQDYVSQFMLKHIIIKRLHKRLRQEGISIPFPIRTIMFNPSESP